MSNRWTERRKRIARERFEDYAGRNIPEKTTLGSLLEHWADRSVLTRCWELGPCSRCNQTHFVERLNIQKPVICSNCGHRILLPERIRIGYSLLKAVGHSLNEGIVPVVLAGRFLLNMTSRGFFWLPGVKYSKGEVRGDVDLLACCDGLVILGECKSLSGTPEDADLWTKVTEQFLSSTAQQN